MSEQISLCGVREGGRCRVRSMYNEGAMRRRLHDIGLIEGTEVLCLNRSPSGDPTAYLIRGAVIALRREETEKILVTYV
ncbi:MAG: FeoA family protein [Oscillospiraceae bacterium]|nr:ferrous iron transport protein A [Oscillospiraceae bacterium]MDD7428334.1 FeoA family protein [Oscillospiraceae bacterium]MDY2847155.1 FeoA family protein [Oscillospiraceae bacterium]